MSFIFSSSPGYEVTLYPIKTQLCRLVLCSTVMYLICLNLPVLSASPRNETHLCGFSEQQINQPSICPYLCESGSWCATHSAVSLLSARRPPIEGVALRRKWTPWLEMSANFTRTRWRSTASAERPSVRRIQGGCTCGR